MSLSDCEINLILTWSSTCVIAGVNRETSFAITDTKLYVRVVNILSHGNVKLLDQIKSGFKRTISWSKYRSKVTILQQNPSLDYLIDPSFHGVNRLFVLSFPDNTVRTGYTEYFIPSVEIKDDNVMIDGQNIF